MAWRNLALTCVCGAVLGLLAGCGGKEADKKANEKKEPQPVASDDKGGGPVSIEMPSDLGGKTATTPKPNLPPVVDEKPGPGITPSTPSDVGQMPSGSGKVGPAVGRAFVNALGGGAGKEEK